MVGYQYHQYDANFIEAQDCICIASNVSKCQCNVKKEKKKKTIYNNVIKHYRPRSDTLVVRSNLTINQAKPQLNFTSSHKLPILTAMYK